MTTYTTGQIRRDVSHKYPTTSGIRPPLLASSCLLRKRLRGAQGAPELMLRGVAGNGFEPLKA